jgi:hypothetical protein
VLVAAVPETAIHEDGDSPASERDIDSNAALSTFNPVVHAKPEAQRMQARPKPQFGSGVSTAVSDHHGPSVRG